MLSIEITLFWVSYNPCLTQGIAVALKCGATKAQFDSTVSCTSSSFMILFLSFITNIIDYCLILAHRQKVNACFV